MYLFEALSILDSKATDLGVISTMHAWMLERNCMHLENSAMLLELYRTLGCVRILVLVVCGKLQYGNVGVEV